MKQKITTLSAKTAQLRARSKSHLTTFSQKALKPQHRRHLLAFASLLLLTVFATVTIGVNKYYQQRALPGVSVAGQSVAGQKYDAIKQLATAQHRNIQVTFNYNGKEATATGEQLGLTTDAEATARQALAAGRPGGFLRPLQFWQTDALSLQTHWDKGIFQDFIAAKFPEIVKNYKDAELTYSDAAKKFDIQPSVAGQGVDENQLASLIPDLTSKPAAKTVTITPKEITPIITAENLQTLQTEMNAQIELPVRFLYKGKVMYYADPPDIAKWATFTPDPAKTGKMFVTYDKAKIHQFLTDKVSPYIAGKPVDRKVIKDEKTGAEIVVQQGQMGRQLKEMDKLAAEIETAMNNKQSWEKEVAVEEAPYKTVVMTGYERWVEVDLSEQRTTLYNGTTAVTSFRISSGLARTPTVTGEFSVWLKRQSQTMSGGSRASGDYYSLPNVTWVSYFYKDYAFHTAYWHNNFGTPMSHGCVNMREADAKVLYDFAPVGTKVIVHH